VIIPRIVFVNDATEALFRLPKRVTANHVIELEATSSRKRVSSRDHLSSS
jgi:hypothetical protein